MVVFTSYVAYLGYSIHVVVSILHNFTHSERRSNSNSQFFFMQNNDHGKQETKKGYRTQQKARTRKMKIRIKKLINKK